MAVMSDGFGLGVQREGEGRGLINVRHGPRRSRPRRLRSSLGRDIVWDPE